MVLQFIHRNRNQIKRFTPLLFVVLFISAAGLVFFVFSAWRPVSHRALETISQELIHFHSIDVISQSDSVSELKFAFRDNPYIVVPLKKNLIDTKINLSFSKLKNVKHIKIYAGFSGVPYSESHSIVIPVGKAGGLRLNYNILLPDGNYETLRIDFQGGSHNGEARLQKISLHSTWLQDSSFWMYILAIVLAIFILLPGILLFPLFHPDTASQNTFQCLFTAYSIFFYMVGYVGWLLWVKLGFSGADTLLLFYIFLGLPCLCCFNILLGRGSNLLFYLRSVRTEIIIYLIVLVATCFLITHDSNLPLENTWYSNISGPKTYNAFRAHDAVFQYVNGVAISNDEPFEKYYEHKQLIYGVEDREILPGVIYAVFRSMLRNFSDFLADSYLIYTIFGICLNLSIIFPVLVFARRYVHIQNSYIFILAFSLNAFMLVNYYLTWYKMAGGAFFLCGLYILLQARTNIRWGLSGILFGIGTNMHAGSALGIPFFFLWAFIRKIRNASPLRFTSLYGPCVLILLFIALNLPWAVIKNLYLEENNALIKEHFLNGYSHPEGLGKSIQLFFLNVPLQEQFQQRFKRLWNSFRFNEIKNLFAMFRKFGFAYFCLLWNQYEFNFIAFSLYPMGLLLLMSLINSFKIHYLNENRKSILSVIARQPNMLIGLSGMTMVSIILLSYGSHPPDITYHQPMGVLILLYLLLLGLVLNGNRFIRFAAGGYFAFALYRLFAFY